jgi:hypothetical protein
MVSERARQLPGTSFEVSRLAQRCGAASIAGLILLFPLVDGRPSAAQDTAPSESRSHSAQERINRALAAGPASVTANATVVDIDAEGGVHVLRPGTNDFTCMPGDPGGVGKPAMCANKVAMQWNKDFEQHKVRPSTTVPGIELHAGRGDAAQRLRSVRSDQPADLRWTTLDDSVAFRSENERAADDPQAHRRIHHVGRHPVGPRPHRGAAIRQR